jgi:hypothetical protein
MAAAKHTPGRWLAKGAQVYCEDTGETIAVIPGVRCFEPTPANAILMAAAPDLLDSCDYIESVAPIGGVFEDELVIITITGKGLRDLRDALAKARVEA